MLNFPEPKLKLPGNIRYFPPVVLKLLRSNKNFPTVKLKLPGKSQSFSSITLKFLQQKYSFPAAILLLGITDNLRKVTISFWTFLVRINVGSRSHFMAFVVIKSWYLM